MQEQFCSYFFLSQKGATKYAKIHRIARLDVGFQQVPLVQNYEIFMSK